MSLAIGTRLGRYEIERFIGAGGMGEVYCARDTHLGRRVALKTLLGENLRRFALEARTIAALRHPNICVLYDVGNDRGTNYLIMEYIEGAPLKGPLPPDKALQFALQIATALEAAHNKEIVHRDLKPANILVTSEGVKLLDFGIAKMGPAFTEETQTQTGTLLGTVAYMSPEQAQGKTVDARSDIFSFGVVLYEMYSGHKAFLRETAIATLAATVYAEPSPLQAPPQIERIVMRCLRKSPADRFQKMAEVRAALEDSKVPAAQQAPSIALQLANMGGKEETEHRQVTRADAAVHDQAVRPPKVHVTYDVEVGDAIEKRELPFVIGVLTDLSGIPSEPLPRMRDRKFVEVERDTLNRALDTVKPRLALTVLNTLVDDGSELGIDLSFRTMDDFSPDAVALQVPPIRNLLAIRKRLSDLRGTICGNDQLEEGRQEILMRPQLMADFARELAELNDLLDGHPLDEHHQRPLDSATGGRSPEDRGAAIGWLRNLQETLRGGIVLSRDTEPAINVLLAELDSLLSRQVDAIMHHPAFQALESTWQGLSYLVSQSETSARLKIRVLNVNKRDLVRDFFSRVDVDDTTLFKKVYEEELWHPGWDPVRGSPRKLLLRSPSPGDSDIGNDVQDLGEFPCAFYRRGSARNVQFVGLRRARRAKKFGKDLRH